MRYAFRKAGNSRLRVTIDCSQVFIDRPKSLNVRAATWSDYKLHITVKFLICISSTGYVTFSSGYYSGRSNDKIITADREFHDCFADRGFQIEEELMSKFCIPGVPPGARVKAQMTTAEYKTTKRVEEFT